MPTGSSQTGARARGVCLCGGIRFTVLGELRDVVNCHCHRCRRWTGHHMAATRTRADDVVIDDDGGTLTWFAPVPEVEYAFCARCGSSLFWRETGGSAQLVICAGTLDPPTGLRTTTAWWIDEASDYHQRPDVPEHAGE